MSRTIDSSTPSSSKKWRPPFWLRLVAVTALVFGASIGYFRTHIAEHREETNLDGIKTTQEDRKPAPDIDITTISGSRIKLSSFKGQVVLLSFWAHWCAPCLEELPVFKDLFTKYESHNFTVVPVNLDNGQEATGFVANFWKTQAFPFENYSDPEKKAADAFEVDTLPANFVLDRAGRVVISAFGSNDWMDQAATDLIESLLEEK